MEKHEKNNFLTLYSGSRSQFFEETADDEEVFLNKPEELLCGKGESLLINCLEGFRESGLLEETLVLEEKRKLKSATEALRLILKIWEC